MRRMCWAILGLSLSLWSIDSHAASYVQIEQREFIQVVRGVEALKQDKSELTQINRLLAKHKEEAEKLIKEQQVMIEDMKVLIAAMEQSHTDMQFSRDAWRLASWAQTAAIVVLVGGWFLLN